ncbi:MULTISPECIES: glycosyltransferase family 4 protein [unclassified Collinsella]|uniref:glycosyltransferase family 4 protein n=1 Tax=unclassified Collinsella TaxID=2637548 RepID=UPI0012B4145E|nr:glycosyltransferase family 4 protein [Collinsella sp. WCA1-178-WT-3 (M2)]MSS52813.1 glycosyltransferase family 4 protein [Collinsella sp. WCA1-178-WT-3 (M1)]
MEEDRLMACSCAGKKILVVTQHFYPETFRVNDIVKGLIEDGASVDVLCGIPNYPSGEWAEGYGYFGHRYDDYHGASVFRSGEIRRKGNTSIRIFLNYISWPITASLKALRLKNNYDVVFCYNTSPILMVIPARVSAWRNKCPLVTYVLDIWPENLYTVLDVQSSLMRAFAKSFCDKQYAACNKLIALSDSLADNLFRRIKPLNSDASISVIPQHCEEIYERKSVSSDLRSQFGGQCIFLFAGSITPAQGLDTVIEAFSRAVTNSSVEMKLLILGDGMSRAELQKTVANKGLGESILFVGRVDPEVVPMYSDIATAMVAPFADNPELELTIPAKISSCMASSKPILAVMRGEGADAVRSARCGFVSNPSDVNALANNMIKIASMNKDDIASLGANGFDYYREHFSRAVCLDKIEKAVFD